MVFSILILEQTILLLVDPYDRLYNNNNSYNNNYFMSVIVIFFEMIQRLDYYTHVYANLFSQTMQGDKIQAKIM